MRYLPLIAIALLSVAGCQSKPNSDGPSVSGRAVATASASASASARLKDDERARAYTVRAAKALTKAVPGAAVEVMKSLRLTVSIPSGMKASVGLEKPWAQCKHATRRACDKALTAFLEPVSRALNADGPPAAASPPTALRVVMRDSAYVENVKKQLVGAKVERWVGDVWTVLVFDLPTMSKVVAQSDLKRLGLSADAAMNLALAQTEAQVGSPDKLVKPLSGQSIGHLHQQGYYDASLLLHHAAWKKTATGMRGDLLVSTPEGGSILYADSKALQIIEVLQKMTNEMFDRAKRPVSKQILVWRPKGWEIATPAKGQ